MQKDNGNALKLQQKITLPMRTSHQYTDLTVAAEVFHHNMLSQHQLQVDNNLEDTGIKLHSDNSSHSHSSQDSHNISGADNYSEINTFEEIKFASNFGSLPVHEQMKLLENGVHSVTNEDNISVYNLTANLQSNHVPKKTHELDFCDSCNVYKSKCICPTRCITCDRLTTKENLCECDQEFVESLSARIGKHFEENKLSKEELSNHGRD